MLFGQLFFGAKFPQLRAMSERARRAGAATPFLLAIAWEEYWQEPLATLRARLNLSEAVRELSQLARFSPLSAAGSNAPEPSM
jgi:ubiquinone biosynthesis protein Coq4